MGFQAELTELATVDNTISGYSYDDYYNGAPYVECNVDATESDDHDSSSGSPSQNHRKRRRQEDDSEDDPEYQDKPKTKRTKTSIPRRCREIH